jgi:hypothetical protein
MANIHSQYLSRCKHEYHSLLTYRRIFPKPTHPPIAARIKEVREGHWSRPSSAVFVFELKIVLNKFLIAIVTDASKMYQAGHEHCGRGHRFMRPCYQKDCLAWILDSLARSHISGKAAYRAFFAVSSRVLPRALRPVSTGPSDSNVTRCLITWAKGLKALVRTVWAGWALCWADHLGDHIAWWRQSKNAHDKKK